MNINIGMGTYFSKYQTHGLAKDIEGRAYNFKKSNDISRSPCIGQWDILTNR